MNDFSDGAARVEFEAAMGTVLTAAAKLEMVVAIVTWGLAGLPQDIARLVVPDRVERMLPIIRKLLDLRVADRELRDASRAWLGDIRAAYDQRNRIVHGLWALLGNDPPTHMRIGLKPLSPEPQEDERRTPEDLRALAASMDTLARSDIPGALSRHVPGPWAIHSVSRKPDS